MTNSVIPIILVHSPYGGKIDRINQYVVGFEALSTGTRLINLV